jgi:metal-sulfur cluster biosynthetic enzyme
MSLFSRGASSGPDFDDYDEFVPSHLPEPGARLTEHEVLESEEHVEIHRTVRDIFEEQGVYDTTFGYNLAKLNLDLRHPDAGLRYAIENETMLHVEFTPTTAFCPQGNVLTTAASRALNDLVDSLKFERVVVRIADRHQNSEAINADLKADPTDGDLQSDDSPADGDSNLPF